MARKDIGTLWNRDSRNNINDNFIELFNSLTKSGVDAEEARRIAEDALNTAKLRKGYLEDNRGIDYPLKNKTFRGEKGTISSTAKDVILDAKVFGAKIDSYYKLDMIANGYVSREKPRYGITLSEYRKSDFETVGSRTQYVFIYNDDDIPSNHGNANYVKGSDGIDTITVDNGEIACSVTVDRSVLTSRGLEFINLNSTHAPTAIIDPSNYFF